VPAKPAVARRAAATRERQQRAAARAAGGKRVTRRKLTDFDTLTFDCYGTLIDW